MKKLKIKCGWVACPQLWGSSDYCTYKQLTLVGNSKGATLGHPWCHYVSAFEHAWNSYTPLEMINFNWTSLMAVKQFFERE